MLHFSLILVPVEEVVVDIKEEGFDLIQMLHFDLLEVVMAVTGVVVMEINLFNLEEEAVVVMAAAVVAIVVIMIIDVVLLLLKRAQMMNFMIETMLLLEIQH